MRIKGFFLLCTFFCFSLPVLFAAGVFQRSERAGDSRRVKVTVDGKESVTYPDLSKAFASIQSGQKAVVQLLASIDLADQSASLAPSGENCEVTLDLNGFTLAGGSAVALLQNETQSFDLKIVGPGTLFNYGIGTVLSDQTHSTLSIQGPLMLHGGQDNAVIDLPKGFVTVEQGVRVVSCNNHAGDERSGVVRATLVTVDGGTIANCGEGDIIYTGEDGEVAVHSGRILGKGKIASGMIYCSSDTVTGLKPVAWYTIKTAVEGYDCRVHVDDQVTVNDGMLYGRSGMPIMLTLIPKKAGAVAAQLQVKAADAAPLELKPVSAPADAPDGTHSYVFVMPDASVVISQRPVAE